MSLTISRRGFLGTLAAATACARLPVTQSTPRMKFGYAAITWGGDDLKAIDDIAAVGFPGIQLRASILTRFANRPAELRDLLAQRGLTFVALSSGNVSIDPARETQVIDQHVANARFLKEAGGLYLQLIDERPRGRAVTPADCARAGALMTGIGRRAADVGVTVVYHPHMDSIGETPENNRRVLDAADARYVKLLLDVAHYTQGGGDPAAAIREYRDRLQLLHLKDVEPQGESYRFVELGRGRVDMPGVFAALREIRYGGWAVIELDAVPDKSRTPKESAEINKAYVDSAWPR